LVLMYLPKATPVMPNFLAASRVEYVFIQFHMLPICSGRCQAFDNLAGGNQSSLCRFLALLSQPRSLHLNRTTEDLEFALTCGLLSRLSFFALRCAARWPAAQGRGFSSATRHLRLSALCAPRRHAGLVLFRPWRDWNIVGLGLSSCFTGGWLAASCCVEEKLGSNPPALKRGQIARPFAAMHGRSSTEAPAPDTRRAGK
jgi:hypothetical protein